MKADFLAGLTNAFIVLPQGVAFALIAGMPPIYGLYTAIVTPIVAALFGSSYHLISGPTTAISIAIFSAISPLASPGTEAFIGLVLTLTLVTGVIQFIMGLARLGTLVNFVSHSVVIGFTAGAAVLIVTSQVKYVVGINPPGGNSFLSGWIYFIRHVQEINFNAFILGIGSLAIAIVLRKFFPKLPHLLLTMIAGSLLAYGLSFQGWKVDLVGTISFGISHIIFPEINFPVIRQLASSGFAVALLGLIEAVAIARGIATKSHQRINSNQEFIGQGLSNIVGSMTGCYAGSGSFTRTGVNFSAGAKTPLSAIFAALLLTVILLFVAPLAAYLPLATMGGIIMLVAYNLVDWHHIKQLMKTSRAESTVLLITFLSTLFLGLEFAIFAGIIFSLVFYLIRTSQPKIIVLAPNVINGERKFMNTDLHGLSQCPQMHIVRIDGSLFFGAVESIRTELHNLSLSKKHILLVGSGINFIDVSGVELLMAESRRLISMGGGFYFSHLKKSVRDYLGKGYKEKIGEEFFFFHKEEAITHIYKKLNRSVCQSCTVKIFKDCSTQTE